MWDDDKIIQGCKRGKRKAQAALYDKYAPSMRAVCVRYLGRHPEAEDVLHDSLIRALDKISQFKRKGSLEGWLKRIAMTNSIDYLNKKNKLLFDSETQSIELEKLEDSQDETPEDFYLDLSNQEIDKEAVLNIMRELPEGYRSILNLYVIEGLKHKEIASMLGITASTSKSQLSRARKLLKEKVILLLKDIKDE